MDTHFSVFGCRGFIGKEIVSKLSLSHSVQGISSSQVDLINFDSNCFDWSRLKDKAIIITSGVSRQASDQCDGNRDIARSIAYILSRSAPKSCFYLSTTDVYGRRAYDVPIDEDTPANPNEPYGHSKYDAETILTHACSDHGIPLYILRLPGVYGPSNTHTGPVPAFISALKSGSTLSIDGDGKQTREFLFVSDIPRVIRLLADESYPSGTYNLVSGNECSILELLTILSGLMKTDPTITFSPDTPSFDQRFGPSRLLTYAPSFSFTPISEGLRQFFIQ